MTVTFQIPTADELNLDAMPPEELETLAASLGTTRCGLAQARALFPDRPTGYRKAANLLLHYAWNKHTAMQARLKGNIATAMLYEAICDRIYRRLPDWAKGW